MEQLDAVQHHTYSNKEIMCKIQEIWLSLCDEYKISYEDHKLILVDAKNYNNALEKAYIDNDMKEALSHNDENLFNNKNGVSLFETHMLFHTGRNIPTYTKCLAVYGLLDNILLGLKNDTGTALDIKYRCIEIFLRHEIGHILAWNNMYNGVDFETYKKITKYLTDETKHKIEEINPNLDGDELLRKYYMLPEELLANHFAGLSMDDIINACNVFVETI